MQNLIFIKEKINNHNVEFKRPGNGIPNKFKLIMNKIKKNYQRFDKY